MAEVGTFTLSASQICHVLRTNLERKDLTAEEFRTLAKDVLDNSYYKYQFRHARNPNPEMVRCQIPLKDK